MRLDVLVIRVAHPLSVAWSARAEVAVFLAAGLGWALITIAVARVVRPDVVLPLSAGLFALALCGWRLLWTVASDGLYALTRKSRG
jgi:hypothetical protein